MGFARLFQPLRSFWEGPASAAELARWRVIGKKVRAFAAYRYLRGRGIEIGALNHPLETYHGAVVRYVDRFPTEKLRQVYPELAGQTLVNVDQVEDGALLASSADESCDFVIANHVLEHTPDPIGALRNMFRVLKPDGILYLAVPDKRFTFDAPRAVTSYEHLRRDHAESPGWSEAGHYLEWAECMGQNDNESQAQRRAERIRAAGTSIHYHAWTQRELIELILNLRRDFQLPIEIEAIVKNGQELVVVLHKADLG